MQNKPWLSLVNMESKNGTWDFFHLSSSSFINLVKFDENGNQVVDIEMNYTEFEELSQLILRLNGR